ncbi:MAG: FctA domain-containing protein, partial [Erysipelotrichaceae bacterium]|nr:FctA domain-containing protein [Erysipelotrichaceae bacterium]
MLSFGKKLSKMAVSLLLALTTVITTNPVITVSAAVGGTPPHTKNITDNQDGTYTISLDIVGESEKKPNNINVIVIMDTSGSMNSTRMNAAKNAVNSLANALYAYNESEPNTVEMALVRFATTSSVAQTATNNATTFRNAVNGLPTQGSGGTNWESALQTANGISFGDDDQTFAIFVSDGNPTFRTTRNGYNDQYQTGVYGTGQETTQNIQRCYATAVDDAQALATKVTPANFFTIGAFGNVDRMEQLTDDAGSNSDTNYYSAQNTTALNQAIADILAKIETVGFADAEIDDGTTNQVETTSGEIAELLEVDTSSFKYYRSNGSYGTMQPWTDAPEAKLVNGEVQWDLSSVGVLENGVKYTVTFDCYPSQTTYDIIAQLKNGDLAYNDLDPNIKPYIVDNGNGSYSLRTNTNAGIKWDDTRDDEGRQESSYINPDPVSTDADTLKATKEWEGGSADVDELEITVLMDDAPFHTATISGDNDWSTESFISIGIIKNGQVLPGVEGHDFKFAELGGEQYHWELETPTVRPMLIDGTKTMLIKVDKDHPAPSGAQKYTINGAEYYVDTSAASLTAINHRRSNLNLKKIVTGEDAPKDATFPFTLTVNNSAAPATAPSETEDPEHETDYWLWFSIWDTKAGAAVMDATVSGTGLVGPDDEGYYYIPSGTPISVQMKDGWNLRFLNLPTGTTYTFVEGELDDGFAFTKAELTEGTDTTFSGKKTTTGTIQNTKTSYAVEYTNDYQLTDLEITKVWVDDNNQDGKRLTAEELKAKLTLAPAVEGKEPTVVDNGDNTYTITYTGLPRFNNGQEVTYTVAESEIDGYTTKGSPAQDHGTITNTHESEKTTVSVEKIWDDNNDIGKIRPTLIQVQLKADDVASGDPVTLNEGNEWTYTWENLPKYKAGKEIKYTADETQIPAGYSKTVAGNATTGFIITNRYTPTPTTANFPVKKDLIVPDGMKGPSTWSYTINVTANNGAPAAPQMEKTVTNSAPTTTFGDIEFTMPGTYTYTVTETGTVPGVTNDTETKTVTIVVEDDGTGKLKATVSNTTDDPVLFTNTYNVKPTEAEFPVEKDLIVPPGMEGPAEWSYKIDVTAKDGAPEAASMSGTVNQSTTSVTFGKFKYEKPGTYTYEVTETGTVDGVTNDPVTTRTVTVEVVDNGDGTLTATPSTDKTPAKFENTYGAEPTTVSFPVKKELELNGLDGPADWSFDVAVAAVDGAPEAETMTGKITKSAPTTTFGPFEYTAPGTYTYEVTESGTVAGVTNDAQATKTVTVKVTDKGDGTLEAVASSTTDEPLTFNNTYNVKPTEAEFPVKKELELNGLDGPADWSFDVAVAA